MNVHKAKPTVSSGTFVSALVLAVLGISFCSDLRAASASLTDGMYSPNCVCNGVADDTDAVQAAFTEAGSTGTVIINKPARITAKVTAQAGVKIRFDATGVLRAYTTQALEVVDSGPIDTVTTIEDLRIEAGLIAPNNGTGFGLKFSGLRANRPRLILSGARIKPISTLDVNVVRPGNAGGFDRYVWLRDLVGYEIQDLSIRGNFSAVSPGGLAGQQLSRGLVMDGQSTDGFVRGLNVSNLYEAYLFTGKSEGLFVNNMNFVGVYYGITDDHQHPAVIISGGHMNVLRRGVAILGSGTVDVNLTDVEVYRSIAFSPFPIADDLWEGFNLTGVVRGSLKGLQTNVSLATGTRYGLKLDGTSGINSSGLAFNGVNKAIYHSGTNSKIIYDGITLNGLGATGSGFTFTPTDKDVWVGAHSFLGSVGTKYDYTPKPSINIDGFGLRYSFVGNVTTTKSASTVLLTPQISSQLVSLNMLPGDEAYTVNVDLSTIGSRNGDYFDFYVLMAPKNPTLLIRNGSEGSRLMVQTPPAAATRYAGRAVFDNSSNWRIIDWHISLY